MADLLVRSVPLMITGLAVAIAFRGGVLNIGADGQLLAGAAAAAAVGVHAPEWLGVATLPLALLAGIVAGAMWSGIAAVLRTRFGVLEVISTIMLNFIAAYGVSYLVRGPLQEPTHIYPQTATIVRTARLPVLIPGTRVHWGLGLALLCAGGLWWVLHRTAFGFRIRAVGANAWAARSAGLIDISRTTTQVFLISGGLAGLAGAVEVCGVTLALYENLSPGYGYTAIAVALLGGLDPVGVVLAAIALGAIETWASALQRNAGVPATLASVVEATLVLAVIAITRWRSVRATRRDAPETVAPAIAGIPNTR